MSDQSSLAGLYRATWGPLDPIALRALYGTRPIDASDSVHVFDDEIGTGFLTG